MGGRVIPARCEQRAGRRFVGRKWTLSAPAGPCRPCSNDQQQASSSAYAVSADSAPAYRLWRTQRQQAREALDRVADQTGAVVVPAPGAAGTVQVLPAASHKAAHDGKDDLSRNLGST